MSTHTLTFQSLPLIPKKTIFRLSRPKADENEYFTLPDFCNVKQPVLTNFSPFLSPLCIAAVKLLPLCTLLQLSSNFCIYNVSCTAPLAAMHDNRLRCIQVMQRVVYMLISYCDCHHSEVFDAGPERVHGWKRERKLWHILGLSKIVCDDEEDYASKGSKGLHHCK